MFAWKPSRAQHQSEMGSLIMLLDANLPEKLVKTS